MGRSGKSKTPGKYSAGYTKTRPRPKPLPGEKRPVVISFTPDSSEIILSSDEAIELRRHSAGCENGTPVVIYTSGKVRKVEGSCRVKELIAGTPEDIWEVGGKDIFETRSDFEDYFQGSDRAYAFILDNIKKVKPFPLPFPGPRSFRYLYSDIPEQADVLKGAEIKDSDEISNPEPSPE